MEVYIDIDGVLLTKTLGVPKYGKELIHFLTNTYDCYWLTTHCRGGENKAIQYLSMYYDQDTIEQLKCVKMTDWMDKKTEGIDFSSRFIWLEDYPFESEKKDLDMKGCLSSLVLVDLKNDNELKTIELKLIALSRNM